MKYDKLFMGAYNLHLINTDKFKTITVDINFRSKINDDITIRNLLKMVLLDSNMNYKTEMSLVKETESLYDLKVLSSLNRIGNTSNMSFKLRFLNEKFTEENMNNESILFLLDLIFNPYVNDNCFNEEVVSKCKEKLRKIILSIKDNKIKYAITKLLETTKDMPYSKDGYGNIEELDKIDGKILYQYYKNMLKNDLIDVFVVGEFDNEKIKELFKEKFKIETFKKINNNSLIVKELDKKKKVTYYKEYDDVNQMQLTILCSLHNLTKEERNYAIKVYNEILGGTANSMLFTNVREKNSLCYYINSLVKAYDNILFIYSGINSSNKTKCINLIKKTMANISSGKIDDEVLNSAKETIISSLKASLDNPNGIINSYYAKELVDSPDILEKQEKFNNVTKQDIINVSKKVNIYNILTLEKGDKDENN